jgi:hypothetical protein
MGFTHPHPPSSVEWSAQRGGHDGNRMGPGIVGNQASKIFNTELASGRGRTAMAENGGRHTSHAGVRAFFMVEAGRQSEFHGEAQGSNGASRGG